MSVPEQRGSYAHTSIPHRRKKAQKLIAILSHYAKLDGVTALEIGTGSGVISNSLASAVGPQGEVFSVDVVDQRVVRDDYRFQRVNDTKLPFADGKFDLVVSNHVIEHVGDRKAQLEHLREIARVLNSNGIAYLAVPNRWAPVEPHFGLKFLSWLPSPLAHAYVRATGKGDAYDCLPPGPLTARSLIKRAQLDYRNCAALAVKSLARTETPGRLITLAAQLPNPILNTLSFAFPTLVFVLTHKPPT